MGRVGGSTGTWPAQRAPRPVVAVAHHPRLFRVRHLQEAKLEDVAAIKHYTVDYLMHKALQTAVAGRVAMNKTGREAAVLYWSRGRPRGRARAFLL